MGGYRAAIYRSVTSVFGPVPTFHPERDLVDRPFVERLVPLLDGLGRYFRASYQGLEHVPAEGPALIVGNHGLLAFDGLFLGAAIYRARGRLVRGLAEEMLFVFPGTRQLCSALGMVHGTRENAQRFLGAGHVMMAYPGGAKDALKKPNRLYQLHWGRSTGFIKVALRAQVPLLILSAIGIDEAYHIVGRIRWTGQVMGSPKYEVPLLWGWGPMPRPVKFSYTLSEPIRLEGRPEDADDPDTVSRLHAEVWQRAQSQLDEGLRRRRSLWRG